MGARTVPSFWIAAEIKVYFFSVSGPLSPPTASLTRFKFSTLSTSSTVGMSRMSRIRHPFVARWNTGGTRAAGSSVQSSR